MIKIASFAGKNVLLECAPLAHVPKLDLRAVEGRFSVLVLLDECEWSDSELCSAVDHLLLHGARYFTVHGNDAERAHDLIDTERDKYDLPLKPIVMTVWIDGSLEEAIEYALLFACPPAELEVDVTELVVIGSNYSTSIDKKFFDTMQMIRANGESDDA